MDWSAGTGSCKSTTSVLHKKMQEILQSVLGCGSTSFIVEL